MQAPESARTPKSPDQAAAYMNVKLAKAQIQCVLFNFSMVGGDQLVAVQFLIWNIACLYACVVVLSGVCVRPATGTARPAR